MKTTETRFSGVRLYRFGPYELDLERNELRKFGQRVKLEPKPQQLLATLMERAGEVVTRSELRQLLWGEGVFVDFEKGLRVATTKLRVALSDPPETPKYIQTVTGQGYRFIAPVEAIVYPPEHISFADSDHTQAADAAAATLSNNPRANRADPLRNSVAASGIGNKFDWGFAAIAVAAAIAVLALVPLLGIKWGLSKSRSSGSSIQLRAVHPKNVLTKQFVYMSGYDGNVVAGYSVDQATGILKPLDQGPVKSGEHPEAAAITSEGFFLYVANRGRADNVCGEGCSISAFAIETHVGNLVELPGSPFPAGAGPVAIVIHPSGKFMYVANVISNNVYAYARLANGALERMGMPVQVGVHPFHLAMTPSGKFLYVSNQDDATVSAFAVDGRGYLHSIAGSPFRTGLRPRAVVITSDERFAYIVNYGVQPYVSRRESCAGTFGHTTGDGCTISVFAIEAKTGSLSEIEGSPFESDGTNPLSAVMDSSGNYLFVSNFTSNNVSVFRMDHKTGSLQRAPGSPFPAGTGPTDLAFDSGGFLYAVNVYSRNISQFEFDPANGRLLPLGDSASNHFDGTHLIAQRPRLD